MHCRSATRVTLSPTLLEVKPSCYAVNVVLASAGYPRSYPKGLAITGLNAQHQLAEAVVCLFFPFIVMRRVSDLMTPGLTTARRSL